jgi:ABC-type amino acid transport substrate-binding protein
MPWSQAVADVRSGRFNSALGVAGVDAVGMQHTEKPQVFSITCAYALNSSKKIIIHASDLKKFKSIGVVKDYSYGEITDKVLFGMKDRVSSIGTEDALLVNIRRLVDSKIEVLIEDINVMSYQINKRKIKNLKKIGCTEDLVPLWIGFSSSNPKSKKWIEVLELTEKELEKSGKMKEIYAHYGIKH